MLKPSQRPELLMVCIAPRWLKSSQSIMAIRVREVASECWVWMNFKLRYLVLCLANSAFRIMRRILFFCLNFLRYLLPPFRFQNHCVQKSLEFMPIRQFSGAAVTWTYFAFIWEAHIDESSRWIPKYFTCCGSTSI